MNHDYAHCLDLKKSCPKSCFRAQLTREVEERDDLKEVPMTWARFKGTDECPKKKKNHAADCATSVHGEKGGKNEID